MARVTVEDCLEKVENRFHLVQLATKRARQLALTGTESFVEWGNDKPTVVALREIAEGFINDAMYENDDTQAPVVDVVVVLRDYLLPSKKKNLISLILLLYNVLLLNRLLNIP